MLHINEIPVQAFISINPLLFNGIVSNVMIESLAHNNASKQRSADILWLMWLTACSIAQEIALLDAKS